jgi:hypothetical protein
MSFSTPHHRSTLSPSGAFWVKYVRVRRSCRSLRSVSWLGWSSFSSFVEVVSASGFWGWFRKRRCYCGSVWDFSNLFGLNYRETRLGLQLVFVCESQKLRMGWWFCSAANWLCVLRTQIPVAGVGIFLLWGVVLWVTRFDFAICCRGGGYGGGSWGCDFGSLNIGFGHVSLLFRGS